MQVQTTSRKPDTSMTPSLACLLSEASGHRSISTGKERDSESGLDDFGARYYSSTMGRFTSPDPLWVKADRLLLPQRLNLYAYGTNNPLRFTDPTGMDVNIDNCPGSMTTSMCEAAIKNGVPKGDRAHIHFVEGDGKDGYAKGQTGVLVDADYKSGDTNFQTLQTAADDHSALANINIEDSGFAPSGMWTQPHGDSIWMRDFQSHFNNQGIMGYWEILAAWRREEFMELQA